jgi:hypothetical protein
MDLPPLGFQLAHGFPVVPEGVGFASGEHAKPKKIFSRCIRGRSTARVFMEICFALHAPYPAGDRNPVIFCGMFPKSRLLR